MPTIDDPILIRCADRDRLSAALTDSRSRTLRTFAAYERSLRDDGLQIPYSAEVNPPLWELGHVGWFQEYWIGRNPQRLLGIAADPDVRRSGSSLANSDKLYDSSRIEHAVRWQLPLPGADQTRNYLARTLEQTLRILADASGADAAGPLYFAWLALMHEDMHHEAALYMANALDIPVPIGPPAPSEAGGAARPTHPAFNATRFRRRLREAAVLERRRMGLARARQRPRSAQLASVRQPMAAALVRPMDRAG